MRWKTRKNHTLVLFDIDGTLIHRRPGAKAGFGERIVVAIRNVYGVEPDYQPERYDGMIERAIVWELVRQKGIPRHDFLKKFQDYLKATEQYLDERSIEQTYEAVPAAVALARLLDAHKVFLGLLTGNAQNIARWKLRDARVPSLFSFGIFGDEADDRAALAKSVFTKARKALQKTFSPADIVVIGDTVHDIRAGRSIGARTIGVTSGAFSSRETLKAEKPDLLVSSLAEPSVRSFLGI